MSELSAELRTVRERPRAVATAVVRQVRDDDVPFMAGSIAYQAFASLVPIFVLLFLLVTVVGDQQLARRVVTTTNGVLPPNAQQLLRNAIADENGVGGAGASAVGLVTLVWGSLKIFRGLDTAFSEIYATDEENSLVDQLHDALVVLGALAVGVVGMVGALSVFGAVGGSLARVASLLVLAGGLTLVFLPMYRYFPDADLTWADAVPGAIVAAVGWMALQFLFRLYLQVSSKGDSSGLIGAVLLLLLWLYLSGLVLLVAAVVNAVLLGGSDPDPVTAGATETAAESLVDDLEYERDRRRSLKYQRARLKRELERERETLTQEEQRALRRQNRRLHRRLAWRRQWLPARLLSRLLGTAPPDPTRD